MALTLLYSETPKQVANNEDPDEMQHNDAANRLFVLYKSLRPSASKKSMVAPNLSVPGKSLSKTDSMYHLFHDSKVVRHWKKLAQNFREK